MRRFLNILKNTFVIVIVCFAIMMVTLTILSSTSTNFENKSILGYKAFIVLTDSMSATDFNAGDLVIVKDISPEDLAVGDIISYRIQNIDNPDEVVTHKIREITVNPDKSLSFITYGTTTGIDDKDLVYGDNVLGKYCFNIPKLGRLVQYLKTTPGYIMCILFPFLLIILIQAINSIRLFGRYKNETLEEMNAERKQIEQERREALLMKEKLEAAEENSLKMREEIEELKKLVDKKSTKEKKKVTKKKTAKEDKKPKEKKIKSEKKVVEKKTTKKAKDANKKDKQKLSITKELKDLKKNANPNVTKRKTKKVEEKKSEGKKK